MSLRSKSREFALQMLFQWEMSPEEPRKLEERFWRTARAAESTRKFANALFEGAAAESAKLDALLAKHSENWRTERFSATDKAILRLGAYELQRGETPQKVVFNESIELAKKYSSEEAGGFVNGILDSVAKSLKAK